MTPKPFSSKTVDSIKPDLDRRKEVPDPALSGLYLVVQTSGAKSWALRFRFGGRSVKMTLGKWPMMTLAAARLAATQALDLAAHGTDPTAEKKAAKAAKVEEQNLITVSKAVGRYDTDHLKQIKSRDAARRLMDRFVIKAWGDRPVTAVSRRDVRDLLEKIRDSGTAITANRVLAQTRAFFNWCQSQDLIEVVPTDGIKPPVREVSRDRVLGDDEIEWLWKACDKVNEPWGRFAKVLLLTGQRLNEVARMTDSEVSGNLWSLSKERTKNGRANVVPLSKAAQDTLASVLRIRAEGSPGYIFTTNGRTPVQGFHKARQSLHEAMTTVANEDRIDGEAPVVIPHWTFHDLRRTAATGMAQMGQPVHVVEAVLNHVSGAVSGVAGIYNRHAYADEKRAALEAWARRVLAIVEGQSNNVVRLADGRG